MSTYYLVAYIGDSRVFPYVLTTDRNLGDAIAHETAVLKSQHPGKEVEVRQSKTRVLSDTEIAAQSRIEDDGEEDSDNE